MRDTLQGLLGLVRTARAAYLLGMLIADALIVVAAVALAYLARFEGQVPAEFALYMLSSVMVATGVTLVIFLIVGLYTYVWRHVGVEMVLRVAAAVSISALIFLAIDVALTVPGSRPVPISVIAIAATFIFLGATSVRAVARVGVYLRSRTPVVGGKSVLIVGAGDAGSLLLRDIETSPTLGLTVVGLVDDDPRKAGRRVRSTQVLGTVSELPELVAKLSVDEILVALPSATGSQVRDALDQCVSAGVPVRVMPSLASGSGPVGLVDMRRVEIADLLGRDPVPVDVEQIGATIAGRVVAVTGAAGSIGSELCRQLLTVDPAKLIMLEIDESRLYEVYLELSDISPGVPEMHVCDIRDERKLNEIFAATHVDLVLHAAAYKHVPLMEIEPDEAVKTNVVGTRNVLDACERGGVGGFVLISTDKAVDPQSVMGLTKAIAERLALDAARRGLRATCVRFGNVLGSRGSVVPLFEDQLRRGGPLRVTHPEITRYFMTIPEAARLVLQAQAISTGGEILVLEMGEPVRIVDLANKMISLSGINTTIEFTGLRPAEKIHEVLIQGDEALVPTTALKVLRVTALPVVPADLLSVIQTLGMFARLNDRAGMRSCFARLIPGFKGTGANALDYVDERESIRSLSAVDLDMETLF